MVKMGVHLQKLSQN